MTLSSSSEITPGAVPSAPWSWTVTLWPTFSFVRSAALASSVTVNAVSVSENKGLPATTTSPSFTNTSPRRVGYFPAMMSVGRKKTLVLSVRIGTVTLVCARRQERGPGEGHDVRTLLRGAGHRVRDRGVLDRRLVGHDREHRTATQADGGGAADDVDLREVRGHDERQRRRRGRRRRSPGSSSTDTTNCLSGWTRPLSRIGTVTGRVVCPGGTVSRPPGGL